MSDLIRKDVNESLVEEIEALEAILSEEDELDLNLISGSNDLQITTRITPLTASDTSRQYVGLYLKIIVDKNLYPEEQSPKQIDLFQVRGLEEKQVRSLDKILQDLCDDPGPVLYTLMDACREYLTEHNYPTCPCSICQYHIVQEDSFVKTPCFHYFHSACFGRYLNVFKPISDEYEDDFSVHGPKSKPKKAENVLPCPVCREDMPKELWNIQTLLKEQDGTLQSNEANTGVFVKTRSLQKLQRKMTVLYEKQKEKGALVQNNFSS